MNKKAVGLLIGSGLVLLLSLLAGLGTASGSPGTVIVDSTTDVNDGNTSSIVALIASPGPDGVISLREAIEAANNTADSDTIEFKIPLADPNHSGGVWTITLTTYLPYLSHGGTIIRGDTQAAFIGGDPNPNGPEIEISGVGMASGNCLTITSADNVIHGLVINRCLLGGIFISGSSATTNTVSGNYIGTDASGALDPGNFYGVRIENDAQNNVIGGDTPGERNIISGNDLNGVHISGLGATTNTVSGNYIGTDATGTQDRGNSREGVLIWGGAENNVIGRDSPGEGNVISGNDEDGVQISSTGSNGNTISGNYIGTDASGSSPLPNLRHGIEIYDGAQNNVIGGDTPGERNVIAFNGLDGIEISDDTSTGNTITQNSIHNNTALGIDLRTGANGGITAPAISVATCTSASGTAPISATVELFTGPDYEGKIYLTSVSADGSEYWGASGFFAYGFYLTATATDLNGNTSEFSLALDSGCRHTYLPLTMKNY